MSFNRLMTAAAALLGLSGVILAAVGAHLLGGDDNPAAQRSWASASLIHLVHAPALLALSVLLRQRTSTWYRAAGPLMFAGVVLFSGGIYWQQTASPATVANIPPMGGFALILSWLCIALGALREAGYKRDNERR